MVIFNSYVKLPEGSWKKEVKDWTMRMQVAEAEILHDITDITSCCMYWAIWGVAFSQPFITFGVTSSSTS